MCLDGVFNVGTTSYCDPGQFTEVLESFQGCDSLVEFTIIKLPADAVIQAPVPISCTSPILSLNSTGSSPSPEEVPYTTGLTRTGIISVTKRPKTSAPREPTLLVINYHRRGKSCRHRCGYGCFKYQPARRPATGGTIGCLSSNQNITLQATTGASGVNFLWSGPGITPINQNLQNPTVSTPGTYTVTVTNPTNGCSSTACVTVDANNTSSAGFCKVS